MDTRDEVGAAHEAWVIAREKVARELPRLILEFPDDDLIRALIAEEVAAHRDFLVIRASVACP